MIRNTDKLLQLFIVCGAAVYAAYTNLAAKPEPPRAAPAAAVLPQAPAQPASAPVVPPPAEHAALQFQPEAVEQQATLVAPAPPPAGSSPFNPYSKEHMEASLAELFGKDEYSRAESIKRHREVRSRRYVERASRSMEQSRELPALPAASSEPQAATTANNPYLALQAELPEDTEAHAEERQKRLEKYLGRTVKLN